MHLIPTSLRRFTKSLSQRILKWRKNRNKRPLPNFYALGAVLGARADHEDEPFRKAVFLSFFDYLRYDPITDLIIGKLRNGSFFTYNRNNCYNRIMVYDFIFFERTVCVGYDTCPGYFAYSLLNAEQLSTKLWLIAEFVRQNS